MEAKKIIKKLLNIQKKVVILKLLKLVELVKLLVKI